ncbi:hypothetical protein GGR54DRAFT_348492 [Hypoxylon sp. NC1633]|nr:hypothetical protein GGR54DRAFT_348492 [Hypoxylon sp. NC1633]
MFTTTAAVLACIGLATAAPTLNFNASDYEFGSQLLARQEPDQFRDLLPSCDVDPSYATVKSAYDITQGLKVPQPEGEDDPCTKGSRGGACWHEYFIVEAEVEYNDWANSGSAIDCASTSRCSSTDVDLGQSCESWATTNGHVHDFKPLDFGFENKVWETWTLKASAAYSYKLDYSETNRETICTSTSARNQCSWDNDDKCHQIWFAQRDVRLYGYVARVCQKSTSKKDKPVQMNTQRADGLWVRGQIDFSLKLPVNKLVGCNALCQDNEYPDPKPNEAGRHQFFAEW